MVAVVIVAGAVLNYRCDPNSGEAERLDVVKLVDKALEVASPSRVGIRVVSLCVIPAVYVVACVAVVESRCDNEVDGVLTHICALPVSAVAAVIGVLCVPSAALVPVFTCAASCELCAAGTVYDKLKIYLFNARECLAVPAASLRRHSVTGVVSINKIRK